MNATVSLFTWWPRVSRDTLRADLLAGLTGALIVLPQGIAYAAIAGLPPEYGLYCAMGPAIVAALFGSSWHMVSGPTAAISIVVFSALSPLAQPGSSEYIALALTLGFLVGAIQLALGVVRLGRLTNYISHAVIVGFTTGAAFLIAASQLKHFFGLTVPAKTGFFSVMADWWQALPATNSAAVIVGVVTLIVTITVRRWVPRWPNMVIGMIAGALTGYVLTQSGANIATVGPLPQALPQLSQPVFDLAAWLRMAGSSFAIAILALTEAVAISRAVALRSGQAIDGNREFVGQGLSNVAGSFLSGYPSSGSFTRSALNYDAGAQTPLAAVFAALVLAIVLALIADWVAYLPIAAMAACLFVVARGLVDIPQISRIIRSNRWEAAVLAITFLSTLAIQLEYAVFVGIAFALILRITGVHRPHAE